MTRSERTGLLVVAILIAGLVASVLTGLAAHLNSLPWFGGMANEIQTVSGPGTFIAVASGLLLYLHRTCAARPWCLRLGEHPVAGTLAKVCSHHHTLEHHQSVYDTHTDAHTASGRLGFGQSHDPHVTRRARP